MRFVVLVLAVTGIVAVACGGGSKTPAEQTLSARQEEARQTPVDDAVRDYAKQLCVPLRGFLENTGNTFDKLQDEQPADDEGFEAFFKMLGQLEEPLANLRDELGDVAPPRDLRDYHEQLLDNLDYAVDNLHSLNAGDFSFEPGPEPATPEEPAGIDAAIVQECGDELLPVADELGGDLFGDISEPETPTPAPGAVGEEVENGNFKLVVNAVTDPYQSTDELYTPAEGKRWVVVDVSITNTSGESQDFNVYDFSVRDADNFQYDPGLVVVEQDLGFGSLLPDETIRGNVGFEVPAGADLTRLVYDPGFFGEGRIDVLLP